MVINIIHIIIYIPIILYIYTRLYSFQILFLNWTDKNDNNDQPYEAFYTKSTNFL